MRKTTSNKALSKAEIVRLIGGDNLLSGIQNPFVTEAAANKAFLSHVEELVALYTERDPGRRPELWWALSAPEERRVVGKAAMISGLPQKVRVFEIRESDSQYLQRLGLGLPHEKSIIREQASADSEQQQRLISNSAALLAMGDGAVFCKIEKVGEDLGGGRSQRLNR